jgi:hypothetical protein
MADFSKRDIEAVHVAAERMSHAATESLAIANKSRSELERHSRTLVAKANINRLKDLISEYPFLKLPNFCAIQEDFKKIQSETRIIEANGTSEPQIFEPREDDPFLRLTLSDQCKFLEVPLEVVSMPRHSREWMFNDATFKKPERAALAYFKAQGFLGSYSEGEATFTLMKCASLDYLAKVNIFRSRADAGIRAFGAQCWLYSHLGHYIVEEIEASNEGSVRANFREIAAHPSYLAINSITDEEVIATIWRAIPAQRWAMLAQLIFQNLDKRGGWPDLTIARENELRFVEVKTTDRLHDSQKNVISEVLKPWGASVSILQIKAAI